MDPVDPDPDSDPEHWKGAEAGAGDGAAIRNFDSALAPQHWGKDDQERQKIK